MANFRFGCVAFLSALSLSASAADPAKVSFTRDIQPIFSDNCFHCHGPDKTSRKAGLRLDVRESALAVGQSEVPAIIPGKSAGSEVMKRLLSADPEEKMPPPKAHKTLKKEQIELIRRWIDEGAVWGKHWAYEDLQRPAVPATAKASGPIDAFIAARLEPLKVTPAPEASRETLIRRLTLDLVGIPPTPAEVTAFAKDASPNAYEKLVDRLLASPRYGERMAQNWLDVARYADTVGYHGDQNHNAWAYRDYVIDAFNTNKPFDVFTREQIAGDLLPNPTSDQLTATCFNRLNMMTREGGAQPKEYLAKYNADRVRTVSMAWLGSTFGCAECHDHKFDPIHTKDFYSLAAFFSDVKQWGVYQDYGYTPNPDLKGWSNEHPFPPEIVVESPALKRRIARIEARAKELAAATPPDAAKFKEWNEAVHAFLKTNPSAWETPAPEIKVSTGKEPKPDLAVVQPDKRISLTGTANKNLEVSLTPSGRWIAAVKLELIPEDAHNKKIVVAGDTTSLSPEFSTQLKDKSKKVAVRFASANLNQKKYSNGFEVFGVQGNWKTEAKSATQPHHAVYFLDPPQFLNEGETFQVKLKDTNIAALRVSLSPLAPDDLYRPEIPNNIATRLQDDSTARVAYLRSTAWNAEAFTKIKTLDTQRLALQNGTTPVMVTEHNPKPLTIRVLPRGNWQDETGEVCKPETPHFLPKLKDAGTRELTRTDLAAWLCSAENPLTARVVMNRLWKQFFGTGLSAQVDDLGAQGEPPSHPELLDWLAVEFREGGWDMKKMAKMLVLSHTYRQVSGLRPELRDIDPNNRMLASQNPRRLEAEVVRDNALAIAGLLNLEMGGPPSKPYQPDDYYSGLQFPDRKYVADKDEYQYRRAVYMHWQRTFLHPMLANFDAPSREDCVAIRTNANSPQQALTLLNDTTFVEAARAWAARLLAEAGANDEARLNLAFQQSVARSISDKEKTSLKTFLDRMRTEYKTRPEDAAKLKKVGLVLAPTGVDDVELAAWTSVCRVILNLHETITRN